MANNIAVRRISIDFPYTSAGVLRVIHFSIMFPVILLAGPGVQDEEIREEFLCPPTAIQARRKRAHVGLPEGMNGIIWAIYFRFNETSWHFIPSFSINVTQILQQYIYIFIDFLTDIFYDVLNGKDG